MQPTLSTLCKSVKHASIYVTNYLTDIASSNHTISQRVLLLNKTNTFFSVSCFDQIEYCTNE